MVTRGNTTAPLINFPQLKANVAAILPRYIVDPPVEPTPVEAELTLTELANLTGELSILDHEKGYNLALNSVCVTGCTIGGGCHHIDEEHCITMLERQFPDRAFRQAIRLWNRGEIQ